MLKLFRSELSLRSLTVAFPTPHLLPPPPHTGSADSPALGCFASGSLGLHVGTHCLVIVLCGRSTLQRWCFPFTRSSYSVTLTPLPSSGVASAQTFVPASTSRGWRKMLPRLDLKHAKHFRLILSGQLLLGSSHHAVGKPKVTYAERPHRTDTQRPSQQPVPAAASVSEDTSR